MSAVLERTARTLRTAEPRGARSDVRAGSGAPKAEAASRHDLRFAREVLAGLALPRKAISCTWLYDHRGSELFEQITGLDEYHAARAEALILRQCAPEIAALAGPRASLVELGSGSSRKTALLLAALDAPAAYLPIDISEQFLAESAALLRARFPGLHVEPLHADFTLLTAFPEAGRPAGGRRIVFFPGATIGNSTPEDAAALLRRIGRLAGDDALLVVGADASRDPAVLLPAYDDRGGITAAFNLNLLVRINRELGADFDPSAFRHEARFDAVHRRIEMHLVSRRDQHARVLGRTFVFAAGESIHTESSYKYGISGFQALARGAGWEARQLWTDARARFAVHVLEREDRAG